jgi:cytochrome c-type biogenesis protein CcmH
MKRGTRALVIVLAALVCVAAPALAQKTERAKKLSKRMMCLCGCNQVLGECNHVGCQMSAEMLAKLDERVARNEPDDLTLQAFIQEYGIRVLAEPPREGFTILAWLMPIVATLAGLGVVWGVLQRMRRPGMASAAGGTAADAGFSPEAMAALRRRADAESED